MGSFFYPTFHPSRFYNSEPQFCPSHWMPDMGPWYGGQPFDHSPYGYRRPFRYPVATRRGHNDGRVWSNLFSQPPQRSRVASVRLPLQQLFDDDFFRSALADDVICLLEHHSQKPDEATNKIPEGGLITGEKGDSSAAAKASSPEPNTQPSTSSAEPSEGSSSSNDDAKKKDTESEKKESSDPCEGYMLRFELSPDGFYRPVYSPVPLKTLRQKQILNDDFFKTVFTDDLLCLLEHHIKEADEACNRREVAQNQTDTSSSEEAVVKEEEADGEPGKPFNVSLKLGDFKPENVNVSLDGRKVIVKAKQEEQGKGDSWKRHSHVEYSFLLPEETPAESLMSSFDKDGILSITTKKEDDTTNKAVECSSEENVETEKKEEETN